jgi:hypothetical protein
MATALTGSVAADGQTPITGNLQMSSNKITSLGTPTSAYDATTKTYVDTAITTAAGSLGTMATQNANAVAITGGTITGLSSALPVASGGTGVTTSTGSGANVLGTSPSISGAILSSMASSVITSGTAVASTSGTSIDFTGIPNWVKRVTVMFNGVSVSGSSSFLIQFGTSGGIVSTGYFSACSQGPSITSTAGFIIGEDTASLIDSGVYVINQLSSTVWVGGGNFLRDSSATLKTCAGKVTGIATIITVRITTVNGTDTFDAGSINILYE